MKYITETELRALYKSAPFTAYTIEPGVRLTPEARQFLTDRNIDLHAAPQQDAAKCPNGEADAQESPCVLHARLQVVIALFLQVGGQMLQGDVLLAQKVLALSGQLRLLAANLQDTSGVPALPCEACTGISEENHSRDLGDCFEITEFHLQLGQGREIVLLHRLRCELRLLVAEAMCKSDDVNREDLAGKLQQVINKLNQLICTATEAKACQK